MADQALPYTRAPDLPYFERPPVTEVSVGLQFSRVHFQAIHVGALYQRFADRYPLVEELPPAPLQVERFGRAVVPGVEFQFLDRPPLPMIVFLAEDRSSLIRFQDGAFYCAWRRTNEQTSYPKYRVFRQSFMQNAQIFAEFAEQVGMGDLPATQAEISYVNEISMTDVSRPDVLASRLPLTNEQLKAAKLPEISTVSTTQHLTFKNESGVEYARLHIGAEPVGNDADRLLRLSMVYRGEPYERFEREPEMAGIMRFLDEGHDLLVRAFVANTTADVHRAWRRVG